MRILLWKVEVKLPDSEKGKSEPCCECRQRKPSQSVDKLEEHLKSVSIINEKSSGHESEKNPKFVPKMVSDSTDYIGNFIGPIGKWQIRSIFLIYLTKIPASWFMACIIFTAPSEFLLKFNSFKNN